MDELNRPLGSETRNPKGSSISLGKSVAVALIGSVLVAAVGYAGWSVFRSADGQSAVAQLQDAQTDSVQSQTPQKALLDSERELPRESLDEPAVKPLSPLEPASSGSTPTIISPSGQNTTANENRPSFKPQNSSGTRRAAGFPNPELVEASEFGSLPKVGPTGRRALDEYSQSSGTVGPNRVAIIVGGLGLSQTGTQEAIEALPAGITLGFSSMGNSLQRWVQKARQEGHEVVLQVPMEPLGYPSINPGPRTLTAKASFGANLGNLRWSLGRMTNYPIVMNYLGAGLVKDRSSFEPLLEEIKNRGLGYIDDGTVAASQAIPLAESTRLPHAQANMTLDLNQNPARIDAQLQALQGLAQQRGFAIGVATAFPVSVERISRWAKTAAAKNIQIVPVSNLIRDYKR
ncbi:MAG: divergent polysaccharide deacetylase family protein [Pseudomonadota bacterium]